MRRRTVASPRFGPGLLGLLLAGFVAACGSGPTGTGGGGGDTSADATSRAPAEALPLEGTPWTLDNASLPTAAPVTVTATFSAGRVAGTSGCNEYTGAYRISGSDLTIDGPIAGTMRACEEPIAAAETAYLAKLPQVRRFGVTGSRLDLLDASGATILTYTATELSLTGTWDITSYRTPNAVISPLPGHEATITFDTDGSLSGNSGCDDFLGTFRTDGPTVSITGLAPSTGNDCPPEVTQQQNDLFAALAAAASMQIRGSQVTLLTSEGTIAATLTAA